MNEQILKLAISQGLWAVLFVVLLFYVLKENSQRESNYQKIIQELTSILPKIKDDIEEIKVKIFK